MTRFIRLLTVGVAALVGLECAAQSKIDKYIERLEKERDVETTYTERRTPKKHKLYRITRVLTFSKTAYYDRLLKVFEEERNNTVSAVKNSSQITYRFSNKEGESTYTLTRSAPYTLVMSWRDADTDDDDEACNADPEPGREPSVVHRTCVINNGSIVCSGDDEHYWRIVETRTRLAKEQGSLAAEIGEIVTKMSDLDIRSRKGAREFTKLERRRTKLQKKLRDLSEQESAMAELQKTICNSENSTVLYITR